MNVAINSQYVLTRGLTDDFCVFLSNEHERD